MGMMNQKATYTLLLILRIVLMGSKFLYIAFLGSYVSTEALSTLLWIAAFVGYAVAVISFEYHFGVVRQVSFTTSGYSSASESLVDNHFGAITFLTLSGISGFLLVQSIFDFSVFPSYLNNATSILLLAAIVYCEVVNTDQYRYFQVNGIRLQIGSLVFRNFLPPFFHACFIYFGLGGDLVRIYLIIWLCCSASGSFFWSLYIGRYVNNLFKVRLPSRKILLTSKFAISISLLSAAYLQLDKVILINLLDADSYISYSIFCMIGLASLVIVQVLFIQPNLKAWYGDDKAKFEWEHLLRLLLIQIVSVASIVVILFYFDGRLPDGFTVTSDSLMVLSGFILFAASNFMSAYMYASGFDIASLKIEAIIFIASYSFLVLNWQLGFNFYYFFPFIFGILGFIFRAEFLRRYSKSTMKPMFRGV